MKAQMKTKNHAQLTAEVERHIAADAVIQGSYFEEDSSLPTGGKGCFIGCLAHSTDASFLQEQYGLPLPLVKICESIFEGLPLEEAKNFFAEIPKAIECDGKDLSLIHWQFLAQILKELPPVAENTQQAVDPVIEDMELLASGGEGTAAHGYDARLAAACADAVARLAVDDNAYAHVAYAVVHAAAHATRLAVDDNAYAHVAYAAVHAARLDADYAAVRSRQKQIILELIKNAPTLESRV